MAATPSMTGEWRWLHLAPRLVAVAVGGFLAIALASVVAVDLLDVAGVRQRLFVERQSDYPYVFYHLFAEGRPVEWLQWLLLVLAATAAAMCAGHLRAAGHRRRSWGLAAFALVCALLAIKDAGNPRHVISWTLGSLAGDATATVAELMVLGGVAVLALFGLAAALKALRRSPSSRRLVLSGYATYAVAGMMSATSDAWYSRAGSYLLETLAQGRALSAPPSWEPGLRSWLLMDSVVEESIELLAAGFLACGALTLLRDVIAKPVATASGLPVGERATEERVQS